MNTQDTSIEKNFSAAWVHNWGGSNMRLPLDWRNVRAIGNAYRERAKDAGTEKASHKSNSSSETMMQQWDSPRIVILGSDRLSRNFLQKRQGARSEFDK